VAREWHVVIPCESAESVADLLRLYHFDAQCDGDLVSIYAEDRARAETLAGRAGIVLRETQPPDETIGPAEIRCWDDALLRYVDPDSPPGDGETGSEMSDEARWRVRVDVGRFRDRWDVQRQLKAFHRPVLLFGVRHVDLLADDASDAASIATRARRLSGVAAVDTRPIRGWIERWWVRQKLYGNYDTGNPGGTSWS
jgi:hypothetical protein